MNEEEIKKVMSYLGKLSVKKRKLKKKDYQLMAQQRWNKKNENTTIRKK